MDEDVRSGADAECPVAAEPVAGVLVGGRGTHQAREQRPAVGERANGKVVHRLGVAGLIEVGKAFGADLGVLDNGAPELADEAEYDLVSRSFAEQNPATLLGGISASSRKRIDSGACGGRSPCSRSGG
jgi:hypothetical protein